MDRYGGGQGGLSRPRPLARRQEPAHPADAAVAKRSEEHTSELQSRFELVCRLLLEKKKGSPRPAHFSRPPFLEACARTSSPVMGTRPRTRRSHTPARNRGLMVQPPSSPGVHLCRPR